VLAGALNLAQHLLPVARMLAGLGLAAAAWRPLLATAIMVAALLAAGPPGVWGAVALGAAVYGAALGLLWWLGPRGLPGATAAPLAQPGRRP